MGLLYCGGGTLVRVSRADLVRCRFVRGVHSYVHGRAGRRRFPGGIAGAPRTSGPGESFAIQTDMLTLLVVLFIIALLGGGVGYDRFGYAGWSPAALLAVLLLVLLLMGRL